ncbi:MAG: 2-succinyl-6-hydroxy-2,4-cyclohexadiene-1-carboxylate synthase [Bacillus sp. (in: Bacteria)]|nr:2-succinyl-6-hydroxy-2,4-cyclohexadiene-1-carboxylate synthase [Bacillus sp. (in: firmicutes)]
MNVRVNGVTYHVKVKGEGKPVVLLHGFTGDITSWEDVLPYFPSRYQWILIDILGHGKSDHPEDPARYDIVKVATDIRDLLEKLAYEKVHMIGYSMGGRLALTFAVLFPNWVETLILESASPGLEFPEERKERQLADARLADMILHKGIEFFIDYWERIPLFATQSQLPEDVKEKKRAQRMKNHPVGLANSLLGMGTGSQPSWWDQLTNLHFPVLLLTGKMDMKFCRIAERMVQRLPMAQHEVIEGVGHTIHMEHPEKFGTIVDRFLTIHKGGSRHGH